jgi:hypothetical protein
VEEEEGRGRPPVVVVVVVVVVKVVGPMGPPKETAGRRWSGSRAEEDQRTSYIIMHGSTFPGISQGS